MTAERGAIANRERYFQGFDHSSWRILPNNITPSDIDVVFDYKLRARQLFCEYTCEFSVWSEKKFGQRLMYQQLLRTSNYSNACVLCKHSVPPNSEIDSLNNVDSFHVMRCTNGIINFLPSEAVAFPGVLWKEFVLSFYGIENNWGEWWS